MNLKEAVNIVRKEFPDNYIVVYVEDAQWANKMDEHIIRWKIYVGGANTQINEMSDSCPTLDEAIKSIKRKLNIDQPKAEDVEVEA